VLGLHVDGGRLKSLEEAAGLGCGVPPRVPVIRMGLRILPLVVKVIGRVAMVVLVVLAGGRGCGRRARRPVGRRIVRSMFKVAQ
jgi:hypothetical protein